MENYIENKSGITFTNIDWSTAGHGLSDKARLLSQSDPNTVLNPSDRQGNPITRTSFGIDAINIDWNGTKPGMGEGTNGIIMTGELMKGVYSPMFAKAA